MVSNITREWFEEWFDSPHYHRLYRSRNIEEASRFIRNLMAHLQLAEGAKLLDHACGRGRHASYLASMGYVVTGLDISPANIQFARRMESENLSFFQHDMRKPFRSNYFDGIFNFFTSFGYFNKEIEHLQTLENVALGLKYRGIFVIDFMNRYSVIRDLIENETIELDGICYNIKRHSDDSCIYKSIHFQEQGKVHVFKERVRAYTSAELSAMIQKAGMIPLSIHGNYDLDPFDEQESDRLIIIARKQ